MGRDISPPPAKRLKTNSHSSELPTSASIADSEPLPPLNDTTIRVLSWNINGITPFLQKQITHFFPKSAPSSGRQSSASLRAFLMRHKWPHVLFLQEVKIATKDTKTQDAVRVAINHRKEATPSHRDEPPDYEAHFTLPSDPHNARGLRGNGKVYGVCSILRSDLKQKYQVKVRTVAWDKEGRISIVELTTTVSKLAIFNVYAVNGTDNPYRDPKTGSVRGTRHDRKLDFHRLLMLECKELESVGWDVVLAGDMNIAPDVRDGHPRLRTFPHQHVINRADFHEKLLEGNNKVCTGFSGVDVWRRLHGDERRYTWFSRTKEWGTSCDRVDYVIAGREVWDNGKIKAAGIMDSEYERGPSDHCPIWVDIEIC